jgi:hypothetical protein
MDTTHELHNNRSLAVAAFVIGLAFIILAFGASADGQVPVTAIAIIATVGIVLLAASCFLWYDSLPLPSDPIISPRMPRESVGLPWRDPTGIRHLERLKAEYCILESGIIRAYHSAHASYLVLHSQTGRLAYDSNLSTLRRAQLQLDEGEKELTKLRARIEALFNGQVSGEISLIRETIKMQQFERQRLQQQLSEAQAEPIAKRPGSVLRCTEEIVAAEKQQIELETDIAQLEDFDRLDPRKNTLYCEWKLAELRRLKCLAIEASSDDDDRMRTENLYDNALENVRQQLSEYL